MPSWLANLLICAGKRESRLFESVVLLRQYEGVYKDWSGVQAPKSAFTRLQPVLKGDLQSKEIKSNYIQYFSNLGIALTNILA